MLKFWSKVVYELDCYVKVFVALVVDHQKGSPGTTRAQLLFTEGAEVVGTIGGGVMETELLEKAERLLKVGYHPPTLQTLYHRATGVVDKSGLICGGAQTMVTMVLNTDHREVLRDMVYRMRYDQPGCLVISPEGISLEDEDLSQPSVRLEGAGEIWKVCFGLLNRRRVHVVGCGHCGIALVRQMHMVGFKVSVVEPRQNLVTLVDLPPGLKISQVPFSSAGKDLEHASMTFAVVMTPSFRDDVAALESLLPQPFPFIGVMGSSAKLKRIHDELLDQGFGEADLNRLTAPVGLPIESDTPEEIAVSIAAQILQSSKQFGLK